MKFSKLSQLFLVSIIGLLVATLMTACQLVSIDYVFVASSAPTATSPDGQIDTYAADSQSGALRKGAATVSAGGVDPVAMAVSSDYTNLYVANAGKQHGGSLRCRLEWGTLREGHDYLNRPPPVSLAVSTGGHISVCCFGHHCSHVD
jgi:hypothetical protein